MRAVHCFGICASLALAAGAAARPDFNYTGPPIPIPDGLVNCITGSGGDVMADINVGTSMTLTQVAVSFHITHTWQGDVKVSLKKGATTVVLVDRPGSPIAAPSCGFSQDNYGASASMMFRAIDTAAQIYDTPVPQTLNVSGDWKPEQALSAFNGQNSAGTWSLIVSDWALDDLGTIQAVTLHLTGTASCYPDCNGDSLLNLADFGCFQTKFALQDPYADCNGDTFFNLADFGCFQTKFALGCP